MIRRTVLAAFATAALLTALAGQAIAHPPPTHLHCLTTPNGEVHAIGMGATLTAVRNPAFHPGFENLHSNVHVGAFHPTAQHPLGTLTADFTAPYTCPPSA